MITIFVAKLDFGVTEQELLEAFERYGKVAKVNLAKDRETGKPRGFAFVEMPNRDEAQAAIDAIDGKVFNGRSCVVKEADDRQGSKPPQRSDSGFKPRTDNKPAQRTDFREKPKSDAGATPFAPSDDDDAPIVPIKTLPKKKLTPDKKVEIDTTNDGKSKKPKMNAYKKSGKDNLYFEDDDLDEDIDLFGRSEDDEDLDDEALSKYLVNADDEDDDFYNDDEEYDDDDEEYDDED